MRTNKPKSTRLKLAERTADRLLASLPGPDPVGVKGRCREAFEVHYGLNLGQMRGYYGKEDRDLDPVWIGWEACWQHLNAEY